MSWCAVYPHPSIPHVACCDTCMLYSAALPTIFSQTSQKYVLLASSRAITDNHSASISGFEANQDILASLSILSTRSDWVCRAATVSADLLFLAASAKLFFFQISDLISCVTQGLLKSTYLLVLWNPPPPPPPPLPLQPPPLNPWL